MASFTEQATLKVVDQASANIRKINAELTKLFATANSLKSVSINIKVTTSGVTEATAAIRKLNAAIKKSPLAAQLGQATRATNALGQATVAATRQVKQNFNNAAQAPQQLTAAVTAATTQTKKLNQQAQQVQRTFAVTGPRIALAPAPPWGFPQPRGGGGAAPPTGGGMPRAGGGGGTGRTPLQATFQGFAGGFGLGLSRLGESFGALAFAAYATAKALQTIGKEGYKLDRAEIAEAALSSPLQKSIFEKLDKQAGPPKGFLKHQKAEFIFNRASFLGDVGNDKVFTDQLKTNKNILLTPEAQAERAVRADVLARHLFENVVPGLYARDPTMTPQKALEGLKKYVQAFGIATTEVFKSKADMTAAEKAVGMPVFSDDFKRVSEGFRRAQTADPGINAGMIRTAMANVKSLGFTMTSEAIAEMLINMGTRGARVANEQFRAYLMGLGAVDVKKVNEQLATELGTFIPGTVERTKGKKGKKGTVVAGSGIPVVYYDEQGQPITIGDRPAEWWRQTYQKAGGLKEFTQKRAARIAEQEARQRGASKAEIAAARQKALTAEPKEKDIADTLQTIFSGANRSAIQGVVDAILGKQLLDPQMAQALTAADPERVNKILEEKWSVGADNAITAMKDAAATTMKSIAEAIDLSTILNNLATKIGEHPHIATAIGALGPAIVVGLGYAAFTAFTAPAATLTRAGVSLQAAAAALMRAAGIPQGGPGVPGTPGTPGGKGGKAGRLLRLGGRVLFWTGVGLAAWDLYQLISQGGPDAEQEEELRRQEVIQQINKLEADAKRIQNMIDRPRAGGEKVDEYINHQKMRLADLEDQIARLKADVAPPKAIRTESYPATEPVEPGTFTKDGKPIEVPTTPDPTTFKKGLEKVIQPYLPKPVQVPTVPTPPTKPVTVAPPTLAPTAPSENLAALIPELAKTSNSITLAVAGLTTAGTAFAAAFKDGASEIGKAGTVAAATLQAAAPSIGSTIGSTAAAAIQAATANIAIEVRHSGNTGGPGNPGHNTVAQ